MMNNNNDLEPVNIPGLAKPGPKKDAWKSGAVMAANSQYGPAPTSMGFMSHPGQSQNQPLLMGNLNLKTVNRAQNNNTNGNSNLKQQNYALEVIQTDAMPMVESKLNSQQMIFVPSKVPTRGLQEAPTMLRLNCVEMATTPDQALEQVQEILSTAGFDVDFTTDEQNYTITGVAFLDDLPSSFKVVVYRSSGSSIVSVMRQSGCHSIAFSSFFSWMEKMLSGSDGSRRDEDFGTPAMLNMPTLSLDMLSMSDEEIDGFSQQDLDMLVQDIQDDMYQVETLGIVFELEGETISSHSALSQAVLDCTSSTDIAVQRLALKICAKAEIVVDNVRSHSALIQKYVRQVSNKV